MMIMMMMVIMHIAYLIFVISFTLAGFLNPNILHPKITTNSPKLETFTPDRIFLHACGACNKYEECDHDDGDHDDCDCDNFDRYHDDDDGEDDLLRAQAQQQMRRMRRAVEVASRLTVIIIVLKMIRFACTMKVTMNKIVI